jgi:small subunit ribosomal protein S19
MSRSVWKGAFVDYCLLKSHSVIDSKLGLSKVSTQCEESRKINKIWSRRSCILPQLVGQSVRIYNGRSFVSLQIIEDMVGHKLGEFASTRKPSNLRRNKTNKRLKGK